VHAHGRALGSLDRLGGSVAEHRRGTSSAGRRRGIVAALAVAVLAGGVIATGAGAAGGASGPCGATGTLAGTGPLTCTYAKVGSDSFTVPAGVTRATFTVIGAAGGEYFIAGDAAHGGSPAGDITGRPGGDGGEAAGILSVTPGDVIQVDVAGAGAPGSAASRSGGKVGGVNSMGAGSGPLGGQGALGGFGGSDGGVAGGPGDAGGAAGGTAGNGGNGSGGGGSSDVRIAAGGCAALQCALASRAFVGAGGGGDGGIGGSGDALGGAGGNGGGTAGGGGGSIVDGGNYGTSGDGATQAAHGAGGLNASRHTTGQDPSAPYLGGDGASGAAGVGGLGGGGNMPCTDPNVGTPCKAGETVGGGGAGGGGGGGLFGGGGGSGGGGPFSGGGGAGGGGGGGSGYIDPGATSAALTSGVSTGDGQVTIAWSAAGGSPPPPGPPAPPGPGAAGSGAGAEASGGAGKPAGGPSVTTKQLRTSLASQLKPGGRQATLPAVLRNGGFVERLRSLEAGTAVVSWSGRFRGRTAVLASGQRRFTRGQSATFKLALTPAGRRALAGVTRISLNVRCAFTPSGRAAVSVTEPFVLRA
jgi:hypothetical protein